MKALNTSNETVLALGANFSHSADSHLVAMQVEIFAICAFTLCSGGGWKLSNPGNQYSEQGADGNWSKVVKVESLLLVTFFFCSFVVFNGALKSTANLTAKSSIVEDGLMVQVSTSSSGDSDKENAPRSSLTTWGW